MNARIMEPVSDRALEAFRRLLAEASQGGQAKVDAIVALSQRTVLVATWMPTHDGFRTVINGDGQSALPVFTEYDELRRAARRFGWTLDAGVDSQEIGAREALRYILSHDLSFVVVDIASEHAMEIERAEVEPLLSSMAKRDSRGPYAAVGRISSSMLEAVNPSSGVSSSRPAAGMVRSGSVPNISSTRPPPGDSTPVVTMPVSPALPGALPRTGEVYVPPEVREPPTGTMAKAATFGSSSSVRIEALADAPSDDLLSALSELLRDYPEVEWAAFFGAARGPAAVLPTVGLRVDTAYRARVNEIVRGLRSIGDAQGVVLDVLLLDDASLMRQARAEALVFFPWLGKTRA
jgi:hypothetical protein